MNRWGVFVSIVLALLVASYAAIYAFASTRLYCTHSQSIADMAPCFKYDVRDVHADTLIVGDSALLYAIRPKDIAEESGISSYNYGMVGPAFALDPGGVIDHYLATNARPRAIVLYFSPWDRIEPGRVTDVRWFPSALLALQHGGVGDLLRLFRARPAALFEIPPTVVRSVGLGEGVARTWRLAMEAEDGHLDFATLSGASTSSLEGRCPAYPAPLPPVGVSDRTRRALADVRARYGRLGIPVYVYVAPSSACDRAIGAIRTAYAGVADNVPQALPDRYFLADPTYAHVHVDTDGATLSSRLLARFLAARLQPSLQPATAQ